MIAPYKTLDPESDRKDSNIVTYRQDAICGVSWLSSIFVCEKGNTHITTQTHGIINMF